MGAWTFVERRLERRAASAQRRGQARRSISDARLGLAGDRPGYRRHDEQKLVGEAQVGDQACGRSEGPA